MWGMDRFPHLCAEFMPDAVVINNDPWNVARFLDHAPKGLPIIAYMPVDGANMDPEVAQRLNQLAAAVWYTDFGYREAVAAGFRGARHVVPHGIDSDHFVSLPQGFGRAQVGLSVPEGAFIVGNVNRNQPRKRLDLTIQAFAAWLKKSKAADAYLLLHCAKKDSGWNLTQLASYYGIADRLILTGSDEMHQMPDASLLPAIYASLDVQITTTLGEGWGLTTMEGMACGVPQIVPDWAALSEWTGPAVKVPCSQEFVHPEINTIGAIPDQRALVAALDQLYRNPNRRRALGQKCRDHVRREGFQWSAVSADLQTVLLQALRSSESRKLRL